MVEELMIKIAERLSGGRRTANFYRRYPKTEKEREEIKKRAKEIFERIPEHLLIDILKNFLDEGQYSIRGNTKYEKTDGKIQIKLITHI